MNVKELELTNRLASIRNQRKSAADIQKERIEDLINIADSVQLNYSFRDIYDALRVVSKAEGILEVLVHFGTLTLHDYESLTENIIGSEARINYLLNEKRRLMKPEEEKERRLV